MTAHSWQRLGAKVSKRVVLRDWSLWKLFDATIVRGVLCGPEGCRPITRHLLAADVIPRGSPTRVFVTSDGPVRAEAEFLR